MKIGDSVCKECANDEFYEVCGLYYCDNCNVQCDEVMEFDYTQSGAFFDGATLSTNASAFHSVALGELDSEGNAIIDGKKMKSKREKIQSRVTEAKKIKAMSSLDIIESQLDLMLKSQVKKFTDSDYSQLQTVSKQLLNYYKQYMTEKHFEETMPDACFTIRDYAYFNHIEMFYLIYLYDDWNYDADKMTHKLKYSMKKPKKRRKKKTNSKVVDVDKHEGKETLTESPFDEVDTQMMENLTVEDSAADRLSDNGSPNRSQSEDGEFAEVNFEFDDDFTEKKKEEFRGVLGQNFTKAEHEVLQLIRNWEKTTLGQISKFKNPKTLAMKKRKDYRLRPSPKIAFAILYLSSIMINRTLLMWELLQEAMYNEVPCIDLVSWMPEVVLTKDELSNWFQFDLIDWSFQIRSISSILYNVLAADGHLEMRLKFSGQIHDSDSNCEKLLKCLNLPVSFSTLMKRIMDTIRHRMLRAEMAVHHHLFKYDVLYVVVCYLIKITVIDSFTKIEAVNKFKRTWYKLIHQILYDDNQLSPKYQLRIPSHFLALSEQIPKNYELVYLEFLNHLQKLRNRNYLHRYCRFGCPMRWKKRIIIESLLNNKTNIESLFDEISQTEGSRSVEDTQKLVDTILPKENTLDENKHFVHFKYGHDLYKVNFKVNEDDVFNEMTTEASNLLKHSSHTRVGIGNERRIQECAMFQKYCNASKDSKNEGGNHVGLSPSQINQYQSPVNSERAARRKMMKKSIETSLSTVVIENDSRFSDAQTHLEEINKVYQREYRQNYDFQTTINCHTYGIYDDIFCFFAACTPQEFRETTREFICTWGKIS